jgi:hypothetical protein
VKQNRGGTSSKLIAMHLTLLLMERQEQDTTQSVTGMEKESRNSCFVPATLNLDTFILLQYEQQRILRLLRRKEHMSSLK